VVVGVASLPGAYEHGGLTRGASNLLYAPKIWFVPEKNVKKPKTCFEFSVFVLILHRNGEERL